MEVITPELIATEQVTVPASSNVWTEEQMDFGVRFPVAAMINECEISWQPAVAGGFTLENRWAAAISLSSLSNISQGPDINSAALLQSVLSIWEEGAATSVAILGTNGLWRRDWYQLETQARPFAIGTLQVAGENTGTVGESALVSFVVRYQLVRLAAEEFASIRAALP